MLAAISAVAGALAKDDSDPVNLVSLRFTASLERLSSEGKKCYWQCIAKAAPFILAVYKDNFNPR
jgi:hypothetical protein